MQSGMADSQIDCNSIRKNVYCSKIMLLQIFAVYNKQYY